MMDKGMDPNSRAWSYNLANKWNFKLRFTKPQDVAYGVRDEDDPWTNTGK